MFIDTGEQARIQNEMDGWRRNAEGGEGGRATEEGRAGSDSLTDEKIVSEP